MKNFYHLNNFSTNLNFVTVVISAGKFFQQVSIFILKKFNKIFQTVSNYLYLTKETRMKEKQEIKKTYFQKQGVFSMKCGLHAVNNLLGKPQYNKSDFNQICNQLQALTDQSYQYPVIGGDYDVSVLIKALNKMNFQVQWHDARKQFQKDMLTPSQLQKIQGFLVNLKMPKKFYHKVFRVSGRHWVSIRLCSLNSSDKKLKFDSSKQEAVQMGQDSLYQFLEDQRKKGAQILKVTKKIQKI